MMETLLTVATVLSPIVGVVAIIVALWVSRRSSQEAKQQVKVVYNLLDVVVATQNPIMMESIYKYQQQLDELDVQIEEIEAQSQIVSPFWGLRPRIEDVVERQERYEQRQHLQDLRNKRKEIVNQINLIQTYFNKVSK